MCLRQCHSPQRSRRRYPLPHLFLNSGVNCHFVRHAKQHNSEVGCFGIELPQTTCVVHKMPIHAKLANNSATNSSHFVIIHKLMDDSIISATLKCVNYWFLLQKEQIEAQHSASKSPASSLATASPSLSFCPSQSSSKIHAIWTGGKFTDIKKATSCVDMAVVTFVPILICASLPSPVKNCCDSKCVVGFTARKKIIFVAMSVVM